MISEILGSLPDFREKVENKEISLCLLRDDENPKAPVNGYNDIATMEILNSPVYSNCNLGISLLGPKYVGDRFLCCIDIDGDTGLDDLDDEQKRLNKTTTQQWFYQILIEEFRKKEITPLVVRTMSGGYHLYVYIYETPKSIHGFSRYLYPLKNMETLSVFEKWENLFEQNPTLFNFLNKPMKDSSIEVFSEKRMMVAPGSCIDGKYYTIHPDGAQSFDEIGEVVEENISDLIHNALISNFFTINPEKPKLYEPQKINTEQRTLSQFNVERIADLIANLFPSMDGQKHYCTLALGGYLKTQNIDPNSIFQIGQRIIEKRGDIFKSERAFMTTLMHDSTTSVAGEATGLKTLQDNLDGLIDRGIFAKKMHLWTQSPKHSFYPNGEIGTEYTQISISYQHHNMSKANIRLKKQDNDFVPIVKNQITVKHAINDIMIVDDISHKSILPHHQQPLYFTYTTRNGQFKSQIYPNLKEMFENYDKIQGAHFSGSKQILELIYNEFEEFDLLTHVTESSRPGIFLNREKNGLKRYFLKDGIEEVKIERPSKNSLKEAVALLNKIKENYPWKDGKFGIFIKNVFSIPFAYIRKTYFQIPHPSLMLYGEGGTLKSSAGELAISLWGNYYSENKINIVGGGELNSEYRFGRIMDCSSYPLVVNEPEVLFSQARTRELIKDAVNGDLIRNPGGNNPREYYSRRASIYCMNTIPAQADDPAYLRRFTILNYTKTERGDTPEVEHRLSFLNKNGVINSAFDDLSPIGDFITYIVDKHIEWLHLPLDIFQYNITKAIEEESKMDLSWVIEETKENTVYTDRDDQETNTLSLILSMLREPYYKNKAKFLQNADPEQVIRDLVNNSNYYPYIQETSSGDSILINIGFKDAYNARYAYLSKTITLSGVFDYLNDTTYSLPTMKLTSARVKGVKKSVRGVKMTYKEFTRIITNTVNE